MTYRLTDDQRMFRDSVRACLRDADAPESRRSVAFDEPACGGGVWRAFTEDLGLAGLGFDTARGGLGGDAFDLLAVIEPMGEAMAADPFIDTVVLAGRLLGTASDDRANDLVRRIVAGKALVACALGEAATTTDYTHPDTRVVRVDGGLVLSGRKAVVSGAPSATDFLVSARDERDELVVLHHPAALPGMVRHDCRTIDGRSAADLSYRDCVLPADAILAIADPQAAIAVAVDAATAAVCAEAIGLLGAQLRDTVAYTRERRQFGQPLSAFQALQHRMADMKIALEKAVAATYLATARLEDPAPTRSAAVSVAKVAVGKACRLIGQGAVQLHGGMGMTEELAIGRRFQRSTVIERLYGDVDDHLLRLMSIRDHGLV